MLGEVIDQYEILERIAGGGMGEVFKAKDLELDRFVAIKCVRPDLANLEEAAERFRAEARTLAALSHRNIATVYRFFMNQDRLFLVMEYIDGRAFGDVLKGGELHDAEFAVSLVTDALRGLDYAHERGVVHRDIKPGNLMLDEDQTVKVLDFGIAHIIGGTRLTRAGSVVGTPAYMAPEQILSRSVDPRTDLYSMGVVLYELITGKLPYAADSDFELMRAHVDSTPRPIEELVRKPVSSELKNAIRKALEKDLDQRFQSAPEFIEALEDATGTHEAVRLSAAPAVTAAMPMGEEALGNGPIYRHLNKRSIWIGALGALCVATVVVALQLTPDLDTQNVASEGQPIASLDRSRVPVDVDPAPNATSVDRNSALNSDTERVGFAIQEEARANSKPEPSQTADASSPAAGNEVVGPKLGSTASSTPRPEAKSTYTPATTVPAERSKSTATQPRAPTYQAPASYQIRTVKVGAHENQGTGRFARNAGYNAAFALSVPRGMPGEIEVEEFVRVFDSQGLVREQSVKVATRRAGQFKSKERIPDLKTLAPGDYRVQLQFRHNGKVIGTTDWTLTVRD